MENEKYKYETYQANAGKSFSPVRLCHEEINVPCGISHVWNKVHQIFPSPFVLSGDFHNQEILSASVRINPLLHRQIHCLEPLVKHSLAHVQRVRGISRSSSDLEIDRSRGRDASSVRMLVQINWVDRVFLRVSLAIIHARYMHSIAVDHCADIAVRNRRHKIAIPAEA